MIRPIVDILKGIPGMQRLVQTERWKSFRHRLTLWQDGRINETYTQFFRLPSQFEALAGPVLDFVLSEREPGPLMITVLGCSNGAEPYSIASVLKTRRPQLEFVIRAYDIERNVIERAKKAIYSYEEIYDNAIITEGFTNATFERLNHSFVVKKEIKQNVNFEVGNALNPNLNADLGTSDIVYAQNFLVHMKPKEAVQAFNNICSLLNPKAALFIDGMDLSVRQKQTRTSNLTPLKYKIREIHDEARRARGAGWPYIYWGLEPFSDQKKEWQRRYATVYLKGV
jgi:chemotaxis protein methyltransferase CheR